MKSLFIPVWKIDQTYVRDKTFHIITRKCKLNCDEHEIPAWIRIKFKDQYLSEFLVIGKFLVSNADTLLTKENFKDYYLLHHGILIFNSYNFFSIYNDVQNFNKFVFGSWLILQKCLKDRRICWC